MTINFDDILSLATNAALEAGKLIAEKRQSGDISQQYKDQQELVTSADIAADKLIIGMIQKQYPDHRILSEN